MPSFYQGVTLNYGNYGKFLTMLNVYVMAGFISSTVFQARHFTLLRCNVPLNPGPTCKAEALNPGSLKPEA